MAAEECKWNFCSEIERKYLSIFLYHISQLYPTPFNGAYSFFQCTGISTGGFLGWGWGLLEAGGLTHFSDLQKFMISFKIFIISTNEMTFKGLTREKEPQNLSIFKQI